MIPSSTIDEIRNKTDILKVVEEYVPMKKRGKNYLGLCPFHSEKTPSFTVSPDKQIFHCFGCGEGGNVFSFLMKAESVNFAEAVAMLGEKLGIRVEATGPSAPASVEKDRYFTIMEFAQEFFAGRLKEADGENARKYIEKRGLSEETVKAFGLGYAPASWDSLMNFLSRKGVSRPDMLKLGLVIERSDKSGYYDRFRDRLMFPIFNLRGRVIGFSGRALAGEEEAKYINSPDSPVYNKGYSLFGIHRTKEEVRRTKTAVLVEGNIDLLSCWQNGVKNVIAPLGTALTENQAKTIRRFAENVVIAFDLDNAGASATLRSVEILKEAGLNVYVAKYEGGKDPDEAIRTKGKEAFIKSLGSALPFMEYKVLSAISRHNLNEIEAKAKAVKEAAFVIGQEKDEFVRKGYIKLAAEKLGYSFDEIAAEVKRQAIYTRTDFSPHQKRLIEKPSPKLMKAEECLIKLSVEYPEILNMMRTSINWQEFTGAQTRQIAEVICAASTPAEGISHFLLNNLPDEGTTKAFSHIMMSEEPVLNAEKMALDCMNTIKAHHLRARMDEIRKEMAAAEKEGRMENVSDLHKEFSDMNQAFRDLSA